MKKIYIYIALILAVVLFALNAFNQTPSDFVAYLLDYWSSVRTYSLADFLSSTGDLISTIYSKLSLVIEPSSPVDNPLNNAGFITTFNELIEPFKYVYNAVLSIFSVGIVLPYKLLILLLEGVYNVFALFGFIGEPFQTLMFLLENLINILSFI